MDEAVSRNFLGAGDFELGMDLLKNSSGKEKSSLVAALHLESGLKFLSSLSSRKELGFFESALHKVGLRVITRTS